jgi:transposase
MSTPRTRKRPSRRPSRPTIGKPRGVLHPRVQQVGPEHFGIVCCDCHKDSSKFLLADFYGNVLIPPTVVRHNRPGLDAAVAQVRTAFATYNIRDGLIAIERTGRYHRLVQRTFAAAGYETRILHPFVTKQYRQPVDPANKTDDTDLAAIHRATVTGCALLEANRDEAWTSLQLVIRHRRDLVRKGAALNCQIRDHLEAALPGFAACFDKLWESTMPWHLLRHFPTAALLRTAGLTALCHSLQQAGIRFQQRTVEKVLAWAEQAAPGDVAASQHLRFALALHDDRLRKTQEIQALEREIASRLTRTPYVLLLSFPGLNVVSAADFAGEMGPIEHYANPKSITGRAGLRPSRYQSNQVDKGDGALVRNCNRALRAAILSIADNLIACNHHFQVLAQQWAAQGKDPRHSRVKIVLVIRQGLDHATGKTSDEVRYFLSSLPAKVKRLADVIRQHWGIENGLHGVLDVAFNEDRMRQRERQGVENVALLNRLAVSLLRQDKTVKAGVKCKRKRAGWDDDYLLHLLFNCD